MPKRADLFVDPDRDPRPEPPPVGDERTLLLAFLTWQRESIALKCAGLDPEQLASRSVPPSTMSLLGLVRHLADVEQGWFRETMAGEDPPRHYGEDDGPFDGAVADPAVVEEAWTTWRSEIAFADQLVADAPDLDVVGAKEDAWRGPMSLRCVLIHMIEEYARHLGHADLLRERIDGAAGV